MATPPTAKPFAISQQYKANMVEPDIAEEAEPESSLDPPSKKQKVSETGPTTEEVADKPSRKPKKNNQRNPKQRQPEPSQFQDPVMHQRDIPHKITMQSVVNSSKI